MWLKDKIIKKEKTLVLAWSTRKEANYAITGNERGKINANAYSVFVAAEETVLCLAHSSQLRGVSG